MHKRHLEKLAASLRRNKSYMTASAHHRVCNDLADVCAKLNPAFKRDLFLKACDCPLQ